MSGHCIRRITTVAVGTPPVKYSYDEWTVVEIHFHGFPDLSTERNELVDSPHFTCFGRRWSLELYPGGYGEEIEDGTVSVFLAHHSNGSAEVGYEFRLRSTRGEEMAYYDGTNVFGPRHHAGLNWYSCGAFDVVKYSEIMEALSEAQGTLIIEVGMKLLGATDTPVPPFIPENPLCKNMLKRFMDAKSADVSFEVPVAGGHEKKGARKRAKSSPVTFHAHHFILQECAPMLAELSGGKSLAVKITDVKPDIFRRMLYYIYGGKLADEEVKANAKDLIDAADRYGVVNLKLEAEACYANMVTLTIDNVLDTLLYADAKNCALLKEVAMDFVLENGGDMLDKVSFENFPGSMMKDLLTAMTRGKEKDDATGTNYNTMRVSALRKKLHEKGLEIDGSREAMIAILKENS